MICVRRRPVLRARMFWIGTDNKIHYDATAISGPDPALWVWARRFNRHDQIHDQNVERHAQCRDVDCCNQRHQRRAGPADRGAGDAGGGHRGHALHDQRGRPAGRLHRCRRRHAVGLRADANHGTLVRQRRRHLDLHAGRQLQRSGQPQLQRVGRQWRHGSGKPELLA